MRKILPFACLVAAWSLTSCVGLMDPLTPNYSRRYQPEIIAQKGDRSDQVFEVKSKRGGGVDYTHKGLFRNPDRGKSSYKMKITNHGAEFQITLYSWRDIDKGWERIPSGTTKVIELGPRDFGFMATNGLNEPRVSYREPIHATIRFMDLPSGWKDDELLESWGDAL